MLFMNEQIQTPAQSEKTVTHTITHAHTCVYTQAELKSKPQNKLLNALTPKVQFYE